MVSMAILHYQCGNAKKNIGSCPARPGLKNFKAEAKPVLLVIRVVLVNK
jgi:hypothetical protein